MIDYEDIWRENVLPDVFSSARPDAEPLLVLVGGQPGCGKTSQRMVEVTNQII